MKIVVIGLVNYTLLFFVKTREEKTKETMHDIDDYKMALKS